MYTILLIIFLALGLIIGSFFNVVIYRLGTQRTLGGRSSCMSCTTMLSWYDLVPVVSYVCLLGRCRHCKSRISFQYPVVELATALVFGLLFMKFSPLFFADTLLFVASYAFYVGIFSLLLILTVHDLKHKIIPDSVALFFGVMAFISLFLFQDYVFSLHLPSMPDILAGFIISVPFALIWFISRGRWMGLGDAKLAVGLGWLLGFFGVISATIIAFWAGAIIGIVILAFAKSKGLKTEVPFAPFLVLGTLLVFFFNILIF